MLFSDDNGEADMLKEKIMLVNCDITKLTVDAIVNAANTTLLGGGGVDGAIHRAAGPRLLDECKKLGGCPVGEARITKGYNLPAKFVIHTVGPVWKGGGNGERNLLMNAYRNSLIIASAKGIKTIAFPNISTGVYGFPKELAAEAAIDAVKEFLSGDTAIGTVIFVCFDNENFEIYAELLGGKEAA